MLTSARRLCLATLAALLALLLNTAPAHARCNPDIDPDKTDIANARAAVAADCDCAGATTRGAYVSCAAQQATTALMNKDCPRAVRKCASPFDLRETGRRRHVLRHHQHCTTRGGRSTSLSEARAGPGSDRSSLAGPRHRMNGECGYVSGKGSHCGQRCVTPCP